MKEEKINIEEVSEDITSEVVEEVNDTEVADVISKSIEDRQHVDGVIVEETEATDEEDSKSFEEMLADLGDADIQEEKKDFTVDDIKRSFAGSNMGAVLGIEGYQENVPENPNPDNLISEESVIKLMNIMNRIQKGEEFNIYPELPDEVKTMINKYLLSQGMGGFSVQSNTARNALARNLIKEFMTNVDLDRTVHDINKEIENLVTSTGKEMSSIFKDYEKERESYLTSALSKLPEDDPKREVLTRVLDSIYDSYKLDRLKEFVKNTKKFKSIEIEKPQQRIFNHFEDKYKDSQYKMYSLNMVLSVLDKYNKTDVKNGNLLFMMAFARFCNNYNPTIPEEHAFMYYTVYNIILLDIYKDKDYEEFATPLLQNINEIIDILGQKQYKNA